MKWREVEVEVKVEVEAEAEVKGKTYLLPFTFYLTLSSLQFHAFSLIGDDKYKCQSSIVATER